MAAKEKINLLEVFPVAVNILQQKGKGRQLCSPFPVLNIRGCNASLCRKECRKNFM